MAAKLILLIVMMMFGMRQADAQTTPSPYCPTGFVPYKPNICFGVFDTKPVSYNEAKLECKKMGAKLAEPRDTATNDFLRNLAASYGTAYSGYWIGINDIAQEGKYVYDSDGVVIKVTGWDTANYQPYGSSMYNCVGYYYSSLWWEIPCSYNFNYICQYGPPVDGGWSKYGAYSKCSTTCGYGVRNRTRACSHPAPLYGGKNCEGSANDISGCKDNPPCTDQCTLNPCKNGGKCTNIDANNRNCKCPPNYTTPDCDVCSCWHYDDCNQARCVTIVGLFIMLVAVTAIGSVVVVKLWIRRRKLAGKAWTNNKK